MEENLALLQLDSKSKEPEIDFDSNENNAYIHVMIRVDLRLSTNPLIHGLALQCAVFKPDAGSTSSLVGFVWFLNTTNILKNSPLSVPN